MDSYPVMFYILILALMYAVAEYRYRCGCKFATGVMMQACLDAKFAPDMKTLGKALTDAIMTDEEE